MGVEYVCPTSLWGTMLRIRDNGNVDRKKVINYGGRDG